jgi:hypothetical protein
MYPVMLVGRKTRRRRHRITKMNFKGPTEFDKPDKSHLEHDWCEHGNWKDFSSNFISSADKLHR